jgi:hypothetical protein
MNERLKLRVPFVISRDDVERAWLEQAIHIPAVASAYNYLRGVAARAAEQLNRALDIDVSRWFRQGWFAVGAVRDAIQRSTAVSGPPIIVRLDRHTLTSTSALALNADVADRTLPELRLTLKLEACIASATLAIKNGKIELLALGDAIVTLRLKYNDVQLNQHVTGVAGALRDPFKRQRVVSSPRIRVDTAA